MQSIESNILENPLASLILMYFKRSTLIGCFKYMALKHAFTFEANPFIPSIVMFSPSLPYSLGVKHKHSICKCSKCRNALLNGRQPKKSYNIFLLWKIMNHVQQSFPWLWEIKTFSSCVMSFKQPTIIHKCCIKRVQIHPVGVQCAFTFPSCVPSLA